MLDTIIAFFNQDDWRQDAVLIAVFFLMAYTIHLLAGRIAYRLMRLSRFTSERRRPRPERLATLESLISSAISFLAFFIASLLSLNQFVAADTLVWMVGLFSAAFGLGARPLISDFLTGVSFIFENTFDVGEKVEILGVEGIIEAVNLRTTSMRSPTGELYVIPNGEVRLVRNFSRGRFSTADITLKLAAGDIGRALPLLQELGEEAVILLPSLLEPWKIISESGVIGQHTELTLLAKARFGQAANIRPRLLALVQERLAAAEISLTS